MARRSSSSERTKRIFLAALGVIFAAALIYQLFLSGPAPKPKLKPQASGPTGTTPATAPQASAPVASQPRRSGSAAEEEARFQAMLADTAPLKLALISGDKSSDKPGSRGSIFAYYVEPPKPPPPPPPPPPIQVVSIQPMSAVAGTPRTFTLVVSGNKFPADAQILLDSAARKSKRVSETQLSTEITPGDYAFARNINVEVKSQSNPSVEFSNGMAFVVQPAPEPQFIYKGRLGSLGQPQYNYAVFEMNATKEMKRAKVGDTIMGVWRIDSINADAVEITHTQYDIKRRIVLQDKAR